MDYLKYWMDGWHSLDIRSAYLLCGWVLPGRQVCSWCWDAISPYILQVLQRLARCRVTLCQNKNQRPTFYKAESSMRSIASQVSSLTPAVFVKSSQSSLWMSVTKYTIRKMLSVATRMYCTDLGAGHCSWSLDWRSVCVHVHHQQHLSRKRLNILDRRF